MPEKSDFRFIDIQNESISEDIESIFPGWKPGDERVVVLAPHDDDGILGAGHLLLAAQAFGGEAHVVIYCSGCLGYSTPEEKNTIVETRRRETYDAYDAIDLPRENVHRLEFDDLSLLSFVGWKMPGGAEGTVAKVIPLLRKLKATRLVIANHYRENVDHEAVYKSGIYEGPQVGDAIIADAGLAEPIRSALQYAVWGDFSPEDALASGRDSSIRANSLVLCKRELASRINDALLQWKSQEKIIDGVMAQRENRRYGDWMMEPYIKIDPRPHLDYAPYVALLKSTFGEIS